MSEQQLEQERKVKSALALIEQAQGIILKAAHELCPVNGMAGQWSATNRLYDAIKSHWHCVNDTFRSERLQKAQREAVHS